jgi:hypothetical protein
MTTSKDDPLRELVAELQSSTPLAPSLLRNATLPASGIYAWWMNGSALPEVPVVPHPTDATLGLIYVGIGPAAEASNETLTSRLVGKHLDGNTGSSTLRQTLAAHLMTTLSLTPQARNKKVVLETADNAKLSRWMEDHLRVSWAASSAPWKLEPNVIEIMRPPLNIDHNRSHPYCAANRALRAEFKSGGRRSRG